MSTNDEASAQHGTSCEHVGADTYPHHLQVLFRPRIHLHRPHEAKVHAQAAVLAGALQAHEDAVGHRRPLRLRLQAVHAFLHARRATARISAGLRPAARWQRSQDMRGASSGGRGVRGKRQ